MEIRAAIGLNVQRLRRELGLSQEELSFRSGFTRGYISSLEAGRRNITVLNLAKLAETLGTSVEQLIRAPNGKRMEDL